ncbi:MAG: rod-binding protein [Nitrospinaceae bacterium]|jgi:Rod binding domain-containing protein|tara:strand:- start:59 stop:469 length:411 start_codon:yes stop_codon:yes gene_type:complete
MDLIKSTQTQNTLFNQLTEKNLERMRGQSKFGQVDSEKEMEKVARDFESVFVNKLLESMRKAIPKSGLLDSSALDMYQSMMDQEMAKNMSERKGMGLGEMVYKDLSRLDKVFRGESISSSSIKMPTAQKTENTLEK